MILYCVPKLRLMGQKFSVREKMDISGLQVGEPLPHNLFLGKHRAGVGTQGATHSLLCDWSSACFSEPCFCPDPGMQEHLLSPGILD